MSSAQPLQTPSREVPEQVETTTSDLPIVRAVTIEALKTIREELDRLGQHLAAASADISADKVPDLQAAIDCWSSVRKQHGEAEQLLGVSSPRIGDLEAALTRSVLGYAETAQRDRPRSLRWMAAYSYGASNAPVL